MSSDPEFRKVLAALNGTTQVQPEVDLTKYYKYSQLLSDYPVKQAKSYTIEVLPNPYNGYSRELMPRLFGERITFDANDETIELSAATLLQEVDRVFLPSPYEYQDGSFPERKGWKKVKNVYVWIDLSIRPIGLAPDSIMRIVLNVEYSNRNHP